MAPNYWLTDRSRRALDRSQRCLKKVREREKRQRKRQRGKCQVCEEEEERLRKWILQIAILSFFDGCCWSSEFRGYVSYEGQALDMLISTPHQNSSSFNKQIITKMDQNWCVSGGGCLLASSFWYFCVKKRKNIYNYERWAIFSLNCKVHRQIKKTWLYPKSQNIHTLAPPKHPQESFNKWKGIFLKTNFSQNFLTIKCKFCINDWFLAKIILIVQKSFDAIQNGGKIKQYAKLERRSVLKSLVAEKCKPCEIYRRMWDTCMEKNVKINF